MATLSPIITGTPGEPPSYNVGMAETFSWIPIENDANRPLFARAGYITNLSDLSISLSASDINIGSVELADGVNPSIRATIVPLGIGEGNALKVLTQDLESSIDDITIGDKSGNFAAVNKSLSALRILEVAPVTAVSITNQLTGLTILNQITSVSVLNTVAISGNVTILNPISSVSLVNQISAFTILNPVSAVSITNTVDVSGSITILNPISSVSLTNQISSFSITNPTTAVNILNTVAVSGGVTVLNPISAVSLTNQLTSITISNSVTAVEVTNDVLVHATSILPISGSVTIIDPISAVNILNSIEIYTAQTLPISGSVTVSNLISSVSLTNQLTGLTVLNPVTSVSITNTVDVSGSVTVTNPTTGVNVLNSIALKDLNNNNVSVTSATSSLNVNVTNAITAKVDTSTGFPINFADNATVDAFQRLRVSEPVTLFDSKQLHQMSTLFWSNTSLNGNIYHTGDSDPSITLSVSANSGYAIRQTTQRFNYQSGKSMLYMFTGTLKPETNIIKRYGCFSSLTAAPFEPNVGLYFESSNDTVFCVQRNEGFLVPSVSADRDSWNIDKLDGSGPSGQTLELSGTNIFVIDYEWLGVGRVRYGFVLDGQVWYCHKINNTGKAGAYLRTPNHPIRAELRQTGTGSGSMKMICSTVIAEGGSDFSGVTRSVDSGTVALVDANVRRAVLGVRLQYNKLDSVNQIINAGVICLQKAASNQAPYKYEILLNPSGVNGGTWTDIQESNFQYWNGNVTPTIGTGFVIANGYGSAGAGIDLGTFNLKKFLRLGTTINGKRDELFIVVTPLADTDGVFASLSFIESD